MVEPRIWYVQEEPANLFKVISLRNGRIHLKEEDGLWYTPNGFEFGATGRTFAELILWHGPIQEYLEPSEVDSSE